MGEWKLGIFYFNPTDPRIFVPKAIGLGWTVNLARPLSWVFIAGVLAFAIISVMLRRQRK